MMKAVIVIYQGTEGTTYPMYLISWPLMTWLCKKPGHQQPWHWPSLLIIFHFQQQESKGHGILKSYGELNTLRPRQYGGHIPDDSYRYIFLHENVLNALRIPVKFVSRVQINNMPASLQIIAWRWPGNKPLSEQMMVNLHLCIIKSQWVKSYYLFPFRRFIKQISIIQVCIMST